MLTSGQISQLIAQQNQSFAGTAAYSQQVSQSMPGMYTGSFGMPMGGGPGFSYNQQSPLGYDIGSRASGGIMAGLGGMAHFALGAGTLMAGLGMGGPLKYALDPFAGAGAMYRMGGAMGMGMGGRLAMGAAGMLPATALVAGAGHVINSVMAGAQEQSAIERTLGSNFNFMNPTTGGRGFTRQQSMAVGDMVRQLEHAPELMTSMNELTKIMDKVSQMGMMNGITNVHDFGTKFKQTLGTLKDLSKIMSSSMEEALPILQNLRQSGIYAPTEMKQAAMQGQVVGGLTGMNQAQVAQLRTMGSQMGFQMGGYRKSGAQHIMRVAGQLGMANQMGILTNDQITEMTGLEGAEGLQALSGEITQAGYKMSQSALGTAMSIAMAEQVNGKFTGKMDTALMDRFRRGDITKEEMLRMVHEKTGSRGSKMSYARQRNRLRSEMAGSMGVEGQLSMLKMVLGERGYDNPDALNIVSQGFGLDERESEMLVDLGQRMPDINLEMKQRGRSEAKRIATESFMKQNYSWDAIKHKVGQRISNVITEPFKKFGAEMRNSINNTIDDFVDDITGRYKVEVTEGMSNLVRSATEGLGNSRQRLTRMMSGGMGAIASGAMHRGSDMTPGLLGSAANYLTGTKTAGERAVAAMKLTTAGRGALQYVDNAADERLARGAGNNVLDVEHRWFNSSIRTMASQEDLDMGYKALTALTSGSVGFSDKQFGAELKDISKDPDFMLAKAELYQQEVFGRPIVGGATERLLKKYGQADIDAAINAVGGSGGSLAKTALQKLGQQAAALSMSPDKQKEISDRINAFERGGGARIFGSAQAAEEFMQTAKGLQGSQAGEFLLNMFTRNTGTNKRTTTQKVAGFLGNMAAGIQGNPLGGGAVVSGAAKLAGFFGYGNGDMNEQALTGRGVDTRDDYFKSLASRELAGDKLTAGEQVDIDHNKEGYQAIKDQMVLKGAIESAKRGDKLTDEQKKVIAKMGYDEKSFTPEVAQKIDKFMDLMNKAKMDPNARKELSEYLKNIGAQSLVEINQRFATQGKSTAEAVAALKKSGLDIGGKEGSRILGEVQQYAHRLSGGLNTTLAGNGNKTSALEDAGSIAVELLNDKKLSHDQTMRILGTDENLQAAYERAAYVKQRLRTRRNFTDFFSDTGKVTGEEAERLSQIKSKYFDAKGHIKDEAAFTKFMATDEGSKALTAAGAEQRSKYASQADVAKNLESFGQSVTSLATIVQSMQKGQGDQGKGWPKG